MVSPDPSNIIAGLALIVSGYAAVMTHRFNNRQKRFIESQEKLNELLLKKEVSSSTSEKKADLGANFFKIGSNKHRLKIFNKGKAAARNVRIDFPDGNEALLPSEIEEKFPLEVLEPHQAVELIAAVHMQTKAKHTLKLIWSDDFSETNEKVAYLTL